MRSVGISARNKKCNKVLVSMCFKDNLGKAEVMVHAGTAKDGWSISKAYQRGICSLMVKVNLFTCTKCDD